MGMLKVAHNLEDLAEGIGKYMGMADGIEQRDYMDTLITQAFAVADRKFNVAAAAAAKGRQFEHMYEFYTNGVHDGGTLSNTAQSSRLWKTVLTGGGGRKLIAFTFLPAKKPRTQLTSEETGGIDDDALQQLGVNNGKKYYWRNKAENTENMKTIYIRPREAPALFIPTIQGLNDATPEEKKQKFGFRKAYANQPGEWTGGGSQFGTFFVEYWQTGGRESMGASMIEKFNRDVRAFNKELKVSPSAPKPALAVNVAGTVGKNRAKTMKQWTIKTRNQFGDLGGSVL